MLIHPSSQTLNWLKMLIHSSSQTLK